MHRLPSSNGHARLRDSARHTEMLVLHGTPDTANRQAADTYKRTDSGTAQGSACGRCGLRSQRDSHTRAGEKQNACCASGGSKG
jgi:hypothetical protein